MNRAYNVLMKSKEFLFLAAMSQFAEAYILNNIANHVYIYGYSLILITGLLGNTINIIVFSTKLRSSACSLNLIVGDISNNVVLLVYLLPIVVKLTYGSNGSEYWLPWCKLMNYFIDGSILISTYSVCLTAIDRFFYTSRKANHRRFSSKKIARCVIIIVICICLILAIPDLTDWVIYEEYNVCAPGTIYWQYANYFLIPVIFILIPLVILLVTGYKTYRNTRRMIHPILPNISIVYQRQRIDIQVSQMVILQISFYFIQTLIFTILNIYLAITYDWQKSSIQLALETLLTAIVYVLYSTFLCTNFYIYYVRSQSFRGHVHKMLKIQR